MIQVTEEIYGKLSGVTTNTFYNILPADADESGLMVVFELHESGSRNTLNSSNIANDIDLTVKILHPDVMSLLSTSQQIKESLLKGSYSFIRDITFRNAVPIFQDPNLNTFQHTLLFTVYADSGMIGIPNILVDGEMTSLEKLETIEVGAQKNLTAEEIASAYHTVANEFTDAEKTKLSGLTDTGSIDTTLSATSTNPVENKVVTGALDLKVDKVSGKELILTTDITKLSGIASGATKNQTDTHLLSRTNHTGEQAIATVTGLQNALDLKVDKVAGKELILSSDITKLGGIASGATKNQTDTHLLSRTNHSGTQAISTVSGLQTALDGKLATTGKAADADKLDGKDSTSFVQLGDPIMETNPFGGKRLYNNVLNNAIFRARQRWTVTGVTFNADGTVYGNMSHYQMDVLFDGNYESAFVIPAGKTAVININFNGSFPSYPYGYLYLNHYYTSFSESAKLRVYCNYEPHGIGWHEFNFADYTRGAHHLITRTYFQKYNISEMEFVVTAPATTEARLTQIDYHLDRPSTGNEMPYVDKFKANNLYSALNFKSPDRQVQLDPFGSIRFGDSTGLDSMIYRPAIKSLRTDSSFTVDGTLIASKIALNRTTNTATLDILGDLRLRAANETSTESTYRGLHFLAGLHNEDQKIRTFGSSGGLMLEAFQTASGFVQARMKFAPSGIINFDTAPAGTNSIERMRLNHTGNLLIGTTTDAGYKLDVSGNTNISGNISVSGTVAGVDLPAFKTAYDSHNHNTLYLGLNATAADSNMLGGKVASDYSLTGHTHTGVYEPAFTKNTAFNKNFGVHSGTVATGDHSHSFSTLVNKPTTLSGYGITDAATSTHNHDTAYLSSAHAASGVTSTKISNWDTVSDKVGNDSDTYTTTAKVTQIVSLPQAEYDAITTKSDSTLYIIV